MRKILLALFLITCSLSGFCQNEAPVKWQVSVKMNGTDKGTVIFKARVLPGWHLYGMNLPEGGPKATVIDMTGSTGVEFTTPLKSDRTPVKVHDSMFDLDLTWWDSDIAFRRDFKVKKPGDARIAGKISYMSCNDQTCSPPKTQAFDKIIK
ncbi:MAG: protein-disulfide reductase DsbD N-terminal domain-containing protein [Paramuribaculum sp.]|nr:protein-disulfide reductase DsbD N-terminal domain-containing protein [Paramuribaculum sp.]MDE7452516.1 protein-disulfide reductase DsbD N-terminal domain-containing protein [Paramuribaculum sp.]